MQQEWVNIIIAYFFGKPPQHKNNVISVIFDEFSCEFDRVQSFSCFIA